MQTEKDLRNNSDIIWHYTSCDVFAQFMEGKTRLYGTHYCFLNDSKEFEYKMDRFKTRNLPIVDKEIEEIIKTQTNPKATERWKELKSKWNDVLMSYNDIYTLCFSNKADNLYHWCSYTPNGGYCIGFSKKRIEEKIKTTNKRTMDSYTLYTNTTDTGESYNVFMGDCVYEKEEDTSESIAGLLLKMDKYEGDEKLIICLHSALTKHSSFEDEKEFRIVLLGQSLRKKIEIIGNKPRVPLFGIEKDEICSLIEGVFVSPHGNKERNKLFAELLREKHNCNDWWGVYLSSSPYIGDDR